MSKLRSLPHSLNDKFIAGLLRVGDPVYGGASRDKEKQIRHEIVDNVNLHASDHQREFHEKVK